MEVLRSEKECSIEWELVEKIGRKFGSQSKKGLRKRYVELGLRRISFSDFRLVEKFSGI